MNISKQEEKLNFSVPTGNFGDIYAVYVAKKMGLPINKLIIATNSNDILKRAIKTGIYKPETAKETVSPSMDIQVASNFERLIFDVCSCNSEKTLKLMNDLKENGEFKLDEKELKKINDHFYVDSLSEEDTKITIRKTYKDYKIIIDPHTAVAIGVTKKIPLKDKIIVLSTAHPSKFVEVVKKEIGFKPQLPENLKNILEKKESYKKLPKDLKKIKSYILEKI